MRINHFKIEKKFLTIREFDLELRKNEIYVITGPNGSGKSTLMESLMFDTFDAVFDTDFEAKLYKTERGRLFSYFPQNVVEYPGTVYEYLKKEKKEFKKDDARKLLDKYNCNDIKPEENFLSLSGGERAKVVLISVLSKGTPYVFLDEPSNNLDKDSVEWLVEVLKTCSNQCIVMITHDVELNHIATQEIKFESKVIENREKKEVRSSSEKNFREDSDAKKVTRYLFKSKMNWIYSVLLLASVVVFCNITWFLQTRIYSSESLPPEDSILLYICDETYEELNQNYVKGRKLSVDEDDYDKMFTLSMIPDLADENDIEQIYIRDESFFDAYYDLIYDNNTEEDNGEEKDILIYSIPECIYVNETYTNWMSISEFTYLKDGRLPKDDDNEVVVSEKILTELGIDKESAIGTSIKVDGEDYEIVGIGVEDIYLVSYEENDNHGIYCYDPETFEAFYKHMKEYYEQTSYKDCLYEGMLLITDSGAERGLLEELICKYPATNYYSYDFSYILNRGFNRVFYVLVVIVTIVCALLYGGSLCMALGGHIKSMHNKVNDGAYYVMNLSVRDWYFHKYFVFIAGNSICSALIVVIFALVKKPETVTLIAMFIFVMLVQLPTVIVLIKQRKKLWERNLNDC